MIGVISQALSMGYSVAQVLNYIGKKFPGLSGNVSQARNRGYSDDDILKFLQGKIKVDKNAAEKQYSAQEKYLSSIGIKTKEEKQNDKARFLKGALGLGSTALGLYGAYRSYNGMFGGGGNVPNQVPGAQQQIGGPPQGQLPPPGLNPQPGPPPIQPQPMGGAPVQPQPVSAPIPQPNQSPIQPKERLSRDEALQKFTEKVKKNTLSEDLMNQFNEAYGNNEIEAEGQANEVEQFPNEKELKQEEIVAQESKEPKPLAKGVKVITPDGDIGTIEDMPGKTAKINVDGKNRIDETENLTPVPENEDEVLDLYERLIKAIPEEYKSSMLNWVGYDPDRNLLQVKFHNGDSYTYEKIPEEFANKIKDIDFLAKTTGNNYYGAWAQGEESRGAGVSQLIRDLQKSYGGKGKEYTQKFKEVYSYFGLPEEKLKQKKLKERNEKKKKGKGNS